jgi:hypothetical protein
VVAGRGAAEVAGREAAAEGPVWTTGGGAHEGAAQVVRLVEGGEGGMAAGGVGCRWAGGDAEVVVVVGVGVWGVVVQGATQDISACGDLLGCMCVYVASALLSRCSSSIAGCEV